jgi:ribonuclease D
MNNGKYFQLIDEEFVKTLPVKCFAGKVHIIDTPEKLASLKDILPQEKILGFDTETKPSFKKGKNNPVSLLQLATDDNAYLIRLNKVTLQDFLIKILEDPGIIKIGVAIKDDLRALCKIRLFNPAGFVELQEFVKDYGIEDNGLKKLVANILGFRISKKNQTSNWERDVLSDEQLSYAATDAWTCLKIYRKLVNNTE